MQLAKTHSGETSHRKGMLLIILRIPTSKNTKEPAPSLIGDAGTITSVGSGGPPTERLTYHDSYGNQVYIP